MNEDDSMIKKFFILFFFALSIFFPTVSYAEINNDIIPKWEYIASSNNTIYYIDINRNNILEPDPKTIVFNMAIDTNDFYTETKMNVRLSDNDIWLYRMEQYAVLDKKTKKVIEQSQIPTYWQEIESMSAPIIQGLAILSEKYPGL